MNDKLKIMIPGIRKFSWEGTEIQFGNGMGMGMKIDTAGMGME